MSIILMITLFKKALILLGEISCWSLPGLKGLSNGDGDGNEKGKQKYFSVCPLRFFVHFFAVTARLRLESS